MQTRDHKKIAYILIDKDRNDELSIDEKIFIFGCMEPDINVLTYLNGSMKYKRMFQGHCRINTLDYILNSLDILSQKDYLSLFDYYHLGKVMHYVMDSFTYPHTELFEGSIKEHREYEKQLHQFLCHNQLEKTIHKDLGSKDLKAFLLYMQKHYFTLPVSYENDLKHIINTTLTITNVIVKKKYESMTIHIIPKKQLLKVG